MLQRGSPGCLGLGAGELGMEQCCRFPTGIKREEGQGKLPMLGSAESCSNPAAAEEAVVEDRAAWEHPTSLLPLAWGTQIHRAGNL